MSGMSESVVELPIRDGNVGLLDRQTGRLKLKRVARGKFKRTQKQEHLEKGDLLDILMCLNHPNLMRVFGYDDEWVEVEFIEGVILNNRTDFSPDHHNKCYLDFAKRIDLRPIKSAIEYLHSNGIGHSDVVSHNIMVCTDGTLKLIDLICCLPNEGRIQKRDRQMYKELVNEISGILGPDSTIG